MGVSKPLKVMDRALAASEDVTKQNSDNENIKNQKDTPDCSGRPRNWLSFPFQGPFFGATSKLGGHDCQPMQIFTLPKGRTTQALQIRLTRDIGDIIDRGGKLKNILQDS